MIETEARERRRPDPGSTGVRCRPARPELSRDEELERAARAADCDRPARDRLVEADLGLAPTIARDGLVRGPERDAPAGEGNPGLIRAAKGFVRRRRRAMMETPRPPRKWHALSAAAVGAALLVSLGLGRSIGPLSTTPQRKGSELTRDGDSRDYRGCEELFPVPHPGTLVSPCVAVNPP